MTWPNHRARHVGSARLWAKVECSAKLILLQPSGELDASNLHLWRNLLQATLAAARGTDGKRVVLDTVNLDFVSIRAAQAMAEFIDEGRQCNLRISIVDPCPDSCVGRVLALMNIASKVPMYRSCSDAIAAKVHLGPATD